MDALLLLRLLYHGIWLNGFLGSVGVLKLDADYGVGGNCFTQPDMIQQNIIVEGSCIVADGD